MGTRFQTVGALAHCLVCDLLVAHAAFVEVDVKNKFGRCGESAGSERKKAEAASFGLSTSLSADAVLTSSSLSNEQRPIQVSCGTVEGHGTSHRRGTGGSSARDAEPAAQDTQEALPADSGWVNSGQQTYERLSSGYQAPPAGLQFKQLQKIPGESGHIAHDCLRELDRELMCTICRARYIAAMPGESK